MSNNHAAIPAQSVRIDSAAVALAHSNVSTFLDRTGCRLDRFDVLNYPPQIWPHLYLLDVIDDGRFHVRLTGDHIREMLGRDCRGCFMDQFLHGPKSQDVMAGFRHCALESRAVRMAQTVRMPNRPQMQIVACAAPLVADGRTRRLVGVMHIMSAPAAPGTSDQSLFEMSVVDRPGAAAMTTRNGE